jgi:hypothetical protein
VIRAAQRQGGRVPSEQTTVAPGGATTVLLAGGGVVLETLMQPATSRRTSSITARIDRSSQRDIPLSIILPAAFGRGAHLV